MNLKLLSAYSWTLSTSCAIGPYDIAVEFITWLYPKLDEWSIGSFYGIHPLQEPPIKSPLTQDDPKS